MRTRLLGAGLLVAATLGLGACSTYDSRGYSGVSVGVNYGSPYYGSRYDRGGYYGWYDDFYYPGTGYYIYDRRGTRHRWSDRYRDYWMARRIRGRTYRDNWSGYQVPRHYRDQRPAYRDRDWSRRDDDRRWRDRRDQRQERRGDRRQNTKKEVLERFRDRQRANERRADRRSDRKRDDRRNRRSRDD